MLRRSKGADAGLRRLARRIRAAETRPGGSPGDWLWSYLFGHQYQGGGVNVCWFDGVSWQADGRVGWNAVLVDHSNFTATAQGGPFATFDGSESLYIEDDQYNSPTTVALLVYGLAYAGSSGATRTIQAKWDTTANNRCWLLQVSNSNALSFSVSSGGIVAATVTSSLALSSGGWYFVAAFFNPSLEMTIWAALITDEELTQDTLSVGVPPQIFSGLSFTRVTIGYEGDDGNGWVGGLGPIVVRANVPAAEIQPYVAELYDLCRYAYLSYPD